MTGRASTGQPPLPPRALLCSTPRHRPAGNPQQLDPRQGQRTSHPQVLKARYGVLWNAKLAKRFNCSYPCAQKGAPSTGKCPLCGGDDSAGHILGECAHECMKPLYVARHDKAARILLRHVRRGAHGARYMLADVGSPDKLAPLGITDKSIPPWILPENHSRVDALIADVPHTWCTTRRLPPGTRVDVIELGYRGDHRRTEKRTEKTEQHACTLRSLRAAGYDVHYHIWDISNTGVMHHDLQQSASALGVADPTQLLREMHLHTVQALHAIVTERRRLEHAKPNMRLERRPP